MIKIENLKFKYHQNNNHVVDIPDLKIKPKSNVLLVGNSGSGKSTLINLLAGLLEPNQGSIKIDNTCIHKLKPRKRNKFRANHIGLISQQFNLIPYLTVFENIHLAHSFQDSKAKLSESKIVNLMNQLKLNPYLIHSKCSELSVGQQQRVAIIRAIINKPKLILADEPTSALDYQAKESFIHVLIDMVQEHQMTLIFISHDMTLKKYFPSSLDMGDLNVT